MELTKRRQGLCGVWQVSLERLNLNLAEVELVRNSERSRWVVVNRDDFAPPGSRFTSLTKGDLLDPGDPTGATARSTMGAPGEEQPELGTEPRSGVGLTHHNHVR